jgi:hypothetical protein
MGRTQSSPASLPPCLPYRPALPNPWRVSEVRRLILDESRDVIELRDDAERPAQIVMVRRLTSVGQKDHSS